MTSKHLLHKVAGVAFVAAAAMSLAACGSKKSSDSSSDDMKIGAKPITKKTTLKVYASAGKNQKYMNDMAKMYNKKYNANIKLKFTTVASGTATVQMITPKLVSHEDMPDIVSIADSSSAGVLAKFEDSFYSASDYGFYKKYGSDFYDQKLSILKAQTTSKKVIPWANDFTPAISYYQPKYFEGVGVKFEDIKSWEQFIDVAKKIKAKYNVKSITMPQAGDQEFFIDLMAQQEQPLLANNGNINLNSEAAKNAAKLEKKMIDAGIVNFFGAQDGEKAFQESASFVAGGWYATNMSLNFPKASGNWKMAPLVPWSESNPGKAPVSGGSSWYVPKKAANPAVAQQFLTYALSNKDALAKALEDGVPVSNKVAYTTSQADKTFDYFGGQKYYDVLNTANKNTTNALFPASYSDATAYVATASYNYWKDGNYAASYGKQAKNFADKYSVKVK